MPTKNDIGTPSARQSILSRESTVTTSSLLPMISASIYCHAFMDQLLKEVILPFWTHTKARIPQSNLWILRYARGGQHLKLRLHVPDEDSMACAACLRNSVEKFLAGLPPQSEIERDPAAHLPPIDPEDCSDGLRPDRSLIWTRYRYLPELIGAEPLSGATGFEAAFVRCLAASTGFILENLIVTTSAEFPIKKRMTLALQLFLAAMAGVHPSVEIRTRYLAYQLEWLLRVSRDRARELAVFSRKVAESPDHQMALSPLVTASPPQYGSLGAWCHAVGDLICFCVNRLGRDDLSELDETSSNLVYFALSRVVHNAINPTAIGNSNEAYLCLLLQSALIRASVGGPGCS